MCKLKLQRMGLKGWESLGRFYYYIAVGPQWVLVRVGLDNAGINSMGSSCMEILIKMYLICFLSVITLCN